MDIWSCGVTLYVDKECFYIRYCVSFLIHILFYRYNIATGLYPFEGDNIYRLLENIGKNQWEAPEWLYKLDKNLTKLILGMLQSDPDSRFTLKQIRSHL